jgi:hypothetical protein
LKPRHLIPAILLALLIAYPLSAGPAGGFYFAKGPPYPSWVVTFYQPLTWATSQAKCLTDAYDWYLDLWERPIVERRMHEFENQRKEAIPTQPNEAKPVPKNVPHGEISN